jgi:hypothetical protein
MVRHRKWSFDNYKYWAAAQRAHLTKKEWTLEVFNAHYNNHRNHYVLDRDTHEAWWKAVEHHHAEVRQYHFDIWNNKKGRTWATWGAFAKQITDVLHEANRHFHNTRFYQYQKLRKVWYEYQVTVYRGHYASKAWGKAEFEGRLKCLTHDYNLMRKSYIHWHNFHHVHHETHWRSGRKEDLLHGQANVTPAQHQAAVARVNAMYVEEYRTHLHVLRVLSTNCVKQLEKVLAELKKNPVPVKPVPVKKPVEIVEKKPDPIVIVCHRPAVVVRYVDRHHHHTKVVNHHHHHHSHRVEIRHVHHHHHHGHHHGHAHWRHHTHMSTLWRGINFTTVYD